MKRFKGKLVSVLLVVSFLLSIFTINVSATSEEYNTVAHHHFAKLNSHIPENVNGSCSYVATSMLLSFYDSYWHDDIIAEYYEQTKPSCKPENAYPNGAATIKRENSEWDDYEEDGGTYAEFIYSSNSNGKLIDQYFHLYLISLGIAQGFYEDGANSESYGITFVEQAAILDFYFDLRFGTNDYVLPYGETNEDIPFNIHVLYEFSPNSSRDTVLQIIEEQVESGNPVLYRGDRLATEDEETKNANTSSLVNDGKIGHAMVAYNVNDDGKIQLHKGHTQDPYSTYPGTEFNLNIGVLWIEINEEALPHSCSDNYLWYPTHTYVCSCEAYKDLHPEHTHENSGVYVSRDADGHVYECVWGDTNKEPHKRASSSSLSDTIHESTCRCGYKFTEAHRYTSYQIISNSLHYKICDCGHKDAESHVLVKQSARYSLCLKCGYTRDHFGGNENVHLGTEEDEETE